ncbi:MAG: hypothetical protein GY869_21035 [Planctomycetes bacterium]|nr:hypothetical protein [Planctomycetota bacterium]
MFSLKEAIGQWRDDLEQREAYSGSDVAELESHLRDEIDNLTLVSLSEEEAFLVATARLGNRDVLAREFAKVNGKAIWLRRFFWMAGGVFSFYMISLFAAAVSSGILYLGWAAGIRGYELGIVGIISRVAVLGGSIWIIYGICVNKDWVFSVRRSCRNIENRMIFGFVFLIILIVLNGLPILTQIFMVRIMPMNDIGFITMVESAFKFAMTFLAPVFLIVIMVWLRRARLSPA